MPDKLMKCGHRSQAENSEGKPVCLICLGINPGATEVDDTITNETLSGRKARCSYYGHKCHSEEPSSLSLAFFSHQPDKEFDSYYDGCYGWD